MGVAADEVNLLTGKVEIISSSSGNVFVPFLGGFGVIDPGTGEKLETEIFGGTVEALKTKMPIGAEGGDDERPIGRGNTNGI